VTAIYQNVIAKIDARITAGKAGSATVSYFVNSIVVEVLFAHSAPSRNESICHAVKIPRIELEHVVEYSRSVIIVFKEHQASGMGGPVDVVLREYPMNIVVVVVAR